MQTDAGTFLWLCDMGETECDKQRLALELAFSLAAMAVNIILLPGGIFLDRFGPRFTSLL
eukprot:Pgem_evm1s17658